MRKASDTRRVGRGVKHRRVVLRLLILKHVRNWSYDTLERELRANLVYRTHEREYRFLQNGAA